MARRMGHLSRSGFFEAVTFSGFVIEELCGKIANTFPAFVIEKAVINNKPRRTGTLKYSLWVDFLRTLVTKKSFKVRLRLTATVTDTITVKSALFGEKEKEVQSQLYFIIEGTTENGMVGYKIELAGKVYPYPRVAKKTYLQNSFGHCIYKVLQKFNAVDRRDARLLNLKDIIKRARANSGATLAEFSYINLDKTDLRLMLALLHIANGITPDITTVLKYSKQETLKKTHKAIERKLLKKGLVTALPGGFAEVDTWGFIPEIDFKFSQLGVRVLQNLIMDNHLLAKTLQGRGYGEEEMVK